jgi:hypothetical protein
LREISYAYQIFVEKLVRKRSLWKWRRAQEDAVNMDHRKISCELKRRTELAQGRILLVFVLSVLKFRIMLPQC